MSILANNLEEARSASGEIRAGGTDLMERRRHHVSSGPLVDISRIPGLDQIEAQGPGMRIGALATIHQLATHPDLIRQYPGLAMAAGSLATPQIRRAGSIGGALLQRTRCWYYRHEDFSCFKKGGDTCPAREGNHQFGVCFDLGPCVFPHPSTLGMALLAYDATVEVAGLGQRTISALYGDGSDPKRDHFITSGEVLSHIHLPAALPGEKAAYFRSTSRARAEWPLVEAIARYALLDGRITKPSIAIGGVANVPLLLPKANAFLEGKSPSEATFREAGSIAAEGANPLPGTEYKVELIWGTVYETLRRAEAGIWGGEG